MNELRLAVIGCGKPWKTEGATGFGMSRRHMLGYTQCPGVKLVAAADLKRDNAEIFVDLYDAGAKVYTDYHLMLREEKPDVVSIATWPKLHCEMVVAAAEAGVKVIHCEKPMAVTFGEATKMAEAAKRGGAQLTFNHQRRFNLPFPKAREILKSGLIGKLIRIEASCSNLYDWGTHWFDMMNFFNDDTDAKWVIGQIDLRGTKYVFDAPCEGQGLSHVKYQNGVHGLMVTGFEAEWPAEIRLLGTDGVIEIAPKAEGAGHLRTWGKGQSGWSKVEVAEGIHEDSAIANGVINLIESFRSGKEPELSAAHALRATELIFATYESARRHGRVDLPLQIEDSPLVEMLLASKI
jgi:UDP-N-acetylglucosamine 3-dehydrogenase